MGLTDRNAKGTPALMPKQRITMFKWAEEKQIRKVDHWMKVVFSDES